MNLLPLLNFEIPHVLSFFAVLIRYTVLIALLPFTGDRTIPAPAKILLAFTVTIALYPLLVRSGFVRPDDAAVWGSSVSGLVMTITFEAALGFLLGFTAKLLFDGILFGSNLIGTFMGLAMASAYDPHHEAQTMVVAELHMALAMLVFLAVDGHHLMLRSALESYRIIGIGQAGLGAAVSQTLLGFTSDVFRFALQISAPVALSMFTVNIAFGVVSRAMPQLNVLVLSFAVTIFIGLVVMLMSVPEFQGASRNLFSRMGDWMNEMLMAMKRDAV